MWINRLDIRDLRVIEHVELAPARGINLIVGGNGAGKTSILEAIYLAGRGRTFRHSSAGPMIRRGADATMVVVHLESKDRESHVLGLSRAKSQFRCRIDGTDVHRRSTLVETLPVQWLGSQPQQFLDRGPDVRRRFFDMGMFHVEHGYLTLYAEVSRVLKQRNAALKSGRADAVMAWDAALGTAGQALAERRQAFTADLIDRAREIIAAWQLGFEVSYRYRRGWAEDQSLDDALRRRLELDIKTGFTSVGPQRAEIELLTDNNALAEKTLSRGQQKMLVFGLNLALHDLIAKAERARPVFLIDDLGAELDADNQARVIDALDTRHAQAFITAITAPSTDSGDDRASAMFHVEHGAVTPPSCD